MSRRDRVQDILNALLIAILGVNQRPTTGYIAPTGWHLSVKVHRHLWVTLTGNYHPSSACHSPIFAVGGPGTSCFLAICDLYYTLMTIHLAILALDVVSATDAANTPDVFVDEGVEALAPM